MTNRVAITTKLSAHTLTTLGTWGKKDSATLTASYHDETTVRVDIYANSMVLTEREWLDMWDNLRDAGYTRAA